jgi:hypothetical protein
MPGRQGAGVSALPIRLTVRSGSTLGTEPPYRPFSETFRLWITPADRSTRRAMPEHRIVASTNKQQQRDDESRLLGYKLGRLNGNLPASAFSDYLQQRNRRFQELHRVSPSRRADPFKGNLLEPTLR